MEYHDLSCKYKVMEPPQLTTDLIVSEEDSKGWSLRSRGDGQSPFGDSQTLDVE
jgi:hypothetical protein